MLFYVVALRQEVLPIKKHERGKLSNPDTFAKRLNLMKETIISLSRKNKYSIILRTLHFGS